MPQTPDPKKHRMEFVLLFDVENGNPNGDPDAGNIPRVDPEDGRGLVTDVCLKRKVRNFVQIARPNGLALGPDGKETGAHKFDIYVRERMGLKGRREIAGAEKDVTEKSAPEKIRENRGKVCGRYYDVRAFGAVMPGKFHAGQVRGPVQMTFAKSICPVSPATMTITRVADEEKDNEGEMGNKHIIPYGLYRCSGFISPAFAGVTGFDADDLALFWEALENMFDHDRSAARGLMVARRLIVFRHESPLGNFPAHKLLEMVKVRRKDEDRPPRAFADYEVEVDDKMPKGVMVEVKF